MSFIPRHKNPVKPVFKSKLVRIDEHTLIEVAVGIPDDEARENYLFRVQSTKPHVFGFKKTSRIDYFKKEDVSEITQEELQKLIDDSELPESE